MQYLDAKKRLAIMMAAARYIRLKLNQNPNLVVDNQEVKVAIVAALQTVPQDYLITVKDLAVITEGIQATLLAAKEDININVTEKAEVYVKRYSDLQSDLEIFLRHSAELHDIRANAMSIKEGCIILNALNLVSMAVDHAKTIIAEEGKLKISSEAIQTDVCASELLQVEAFNSISEFSELAKAKAISTGIVDQHLTVAHRLIIELEEIKASISINNRIMTKANLVLDLLRFIVLQTQAQSINSSYSNVVADLSSRSLQSTASLTITGKLSFEFMIMLGLRLVDTTRSQAEINAQADLAVHVIMEEKILAECEPRLLDVMSHHLGVDDFISSDGQLSMDFEQFVAVYFSINELITTKDIVKLGKTKPIVSQIIAKLYVSPEVNLSFLGGCDLSSDDYLTIKESVTLGRFIYAIIQSFDAENLNALDTLILDDLIYISK